MFLARQSDDGANAGGNAQPRRRRILLPAILVTVAIWAIFSWPLPRYVTSGIPSSSQNVELHNTLRMQHGDHLQLLYHFWLASDMLGAGTSFMYNPYEFNIGDDAERYEPGAYYFPFSSIFTLGHWLAGRAFGWNLAGLLSLIVTYWTTWALTRRFTSSATVSAVAALLAILLPYRWHTLLGGSPTGFAMCLVPIVALGIDVAVRDGKARGGVLSGIGILFAYFSDLHVFFFSTLSAPFWLLLAFGTRALNDDLRRSDWTVIIKALLPLAGFGLIAFVLSITTAKGLGDTVMREGWHLQELVSHSPWRRGFLGWRIPPGATPVTWHTYLGYTATLVITIGGLFLVAEYISKLRHALSREARDASLSSGGAVYALVFIGLAIVGVASLALGTNGPFGGKFFEFCRSLIPPYGMVRQPAKIYCLMPTLLSLAGVLGMAAVARALPKQSRLILFTVAIAMVFEFNTQVDATVCALDTSNGGYEAVVSDPAYDEGSPRALALPLWPGNDAHSSLYQHYASLYRIRMLNGYRPAVPANYKRDVFKRLESLNVGVATDGQLDWLAKRGIHHLLLHEDAFPEKLSPFPVSVTLRQLLLHPRLELTASDKRVWTFRILAAPKGRVVVDPEWDFYFPSRLWEAERTTSQGTVKLEDPSANNGQYVELRENHAEIRFSVRAPVCNAPGLHYLIRARGGLMVDVYIDGEKQHGRTYVTDGQDWAWIKIPVETDSIFFTPELHVRSAEDPLQIDMCLLTAGEWVSPSSGETLEIPAPCFFHAGFTDLASNSVVFQPDTEPDRKILYGPNLPLEAGTYDIIIHVKSDGADDENITFGELSAVSGNQRFGPVTVTANDGSALRIALRESLPLRINFQYRRTAKIRIARVDIRRLPDA